MKTGIEIRASKNALAIITSLEALKTLKASAHRALEIRHNTNSGITDVGILVE
jgi:hypothetical protein